MGEFQEPTLVLFGAGALADAFMGRYGSIVKPAFMVDNNSTKWGTQRQGIRIESPDTLRAVPEQELYVVICSRYAGDIARQLVELGVRDFRVFWP